MLPVLAMAQTPFVCAAAGRQLSLSAIDLLPNAPTTYKLRDWRDVAQKFDNLVFDVNAAGQFLPLTRIDTTPQYPLLQESFGIAAYVGETRTYSENGEPVFESLSTLGAVLGGSLVGIDKSVGSHNWVSMTREFSGDMRGLPLILNGPFDGTGGSAWYETIPSILFYSIADLYPTQTELAPVLDVVDDTFYDAVNVLTAGGTVPNFNYTAYNFATHQPEVHGHLEPDMGLGMAWLQHAAYFRNKTVDPLRAQDHLDAVDWSLAYYEQLSANPDYEILTPFGAYTAARMNAEHGRNYDIQKLVSWVFDRSDARTTKIMISGEQWGGEDVGGLMGFTVPNAGPGVRGYAFSMNTFETAMPMVPLARYEDRYSRAIGKWVLNAANAARLFFADAHSAQNQSSEFWTGDPDSSVAYEGLRHHWYSPFDGQELFAGGDALPSPWTSGYGPLTDFALYGGAYVGVFGSIIKSTNVEKILQLDLLATDFYHDAAHSTFLYYNPLGTTKAVAINLASGTYDLYDAVSNRYLARGATSQAYFNVPADEAVMLVLVPSGGTETRAGRQLLVDGVVIDYNATLLPDNLVRNPDVDEAQTNNSSRPTFWHYSSHASWSNDDALSPSHSLELVDTSTTAYEEWRSYATDIPAGEDRSFTLRWFWKYDVAAGGEFRARLRLSNDSVTSLDLTNPLTESNFTVSGDASEFEMFETTIDLPDGICSFDLTFISGGALSALGSIYIDDISAAIVQAPALLGDYNANGIVDAADYIVWRDNLGSAMILPNDPSPGTVTQEDYDTWRAHFGQIAGSGSGGSANAAVPEPTAAVPLILVAIGVLVRRFRAP